MGESFVPTWILDANLVDFSVNQNTLTWYEHDVV